ncbi:MAG TPA: site-specific integrase [Syntrophales bacterium]|nr:site-specific integrase [Syntrophales bacterium]
MTGSVQKKGNVYYAVIALNGKRKWFRGGKRQDAERVLIEKMSEIATGTYREIPKTSFKEFADLWIKNHAENNLKPSTLSGYKHIIEKKLNPEFENFLMTDIHPALLQSYVTKRKQNWDRRGKQKEQNIKYMSLQMGHSSIKITMDTYGHLFNDEDFNRQQVDLLQKTFHAVRNPLEKPLQNAEKGLTDSANPLQFFGSGGRI